MAQVIGYAWLKFYSCNSLSWTDHYFFGWGDGKFLKLKKIVRKDKIVQINCLHTYREEEKNSLQANEIMQHQLRFNNNEQTATSTFNNNNYKLNIFTACRANNYRVNRGRASR